MDATSNLGYGTPQVAARQEPRSSLWWGIFIGPALLVLFALCEVAVAATITSQATYSDTKIAAMRYFAYLCYPLLVPYFATSICFCLDANALKNKGNRIGWHSYVLAFIQLVYLIHRSFVVKKMPWNLFAFIFMQLVGYEVGHQLFRLMYAMHGAEGY